MDRMPSIAKKRLIRKKYWKHLLSFFQRTKSTQNSGWDFAERIEKVKKTKIELEQKKPVDTFIDGYGSYKGISVTFEL